MVKTAAKVKATPIVESKPDGRKYDGDKLRYDLIPPHAQAAMVDVLTFGAQKYAPDNWQLVADAKRRYFAALERHVWAWKMGEQLDPESGIHHLAHAACCVFFLLERDMFTDEEWEKHIS